MEKGGIYFIFARLKRGLNEKNEYIYAHQLWLWSENRHIPIYEATKDFHVHNMYDVLDAIQNKFGKRGQDVGKSFDEPWDNPIVAELNFNAISGKWEFVRIADANRASTVGEYARYMEQQIIEGRNEAWTPVMERMEF
jgi:hypothetical protein